MNLARYCLTNAAPPAGAVALEVVGPGGAVLESWSYGRLEDTVLRIAAGLHAEGLDAGDRVLLRIGHSSDFPLVFFGAIAAGLVPVPTSAMLTATECDGLLADSGAAAIVHDGHTALPHETGAARLIGPDGIVALKRAPRGTYADTAADDPAFMVYTSGTSGRPKGVLHAQRAARGRAPMYAGWYGISPADRLLHAGAFNWTYTLGVGLMDPWANGATSVVYDGPRDPDVWPGLIETAGATLFAAVPSLYRRILKYAALDRASFPTLRHGLTAGEALAADLHREWTQRTGRPLYEALGMSEISTYISSGPDVPTRPGSPGKPQAGRRVAILAEERAECRPLPDGETGLLAVHRSDPGFMLGYWQRPDDTRAVLHGDWFLTGDRAHRDADGYIWYEGRADDVMNAFGYRVAPEEVERVLAAHPDVAEAAVTAVEVRGGITLIAGFVVRRSGASLDEAALAAWANERLAEYKRPKAYRFVDSLPRTPSGKIRRKGLRLAD
ncbi:class I adenylate-forming enzyme family protein [Polymorphum gilvum]|uniref:Benzoate-coenzyme A ligase, putative n=1 Tax=Polymorphum gilvum (strain LMG 25793 / CGMCC 1.9160 / SL003B-26A1) TaxID=991905 RepID=F2IZD5_POLGS|nr:AMP-binding protein [Polymorphum gilvum]ADZ68558.1 Benzoate-coenzyme A ligase, putative [Polymorphum gilvum SL003B-26A1]